MHSAKLACILWLPILALALPQGGGEMATPIHPAPTPSNKIPQYLWPGLLILPSPKPKPPTIKSLLQHLSIILIPHPTPTPTPTPTISVAGKPSGSVFFTTITPGGGTTAVTSVITSIVIASLPPPPPRVTVTVQPTGIAKRQQEQEKTGKNKPFTPTNTDLPEAAPEPEEEKEDKYKDDSSLPPNTNQPTLLRRKNKLKTPQLTLGQLITQQNAGGLLIYTEPSFQGKCQKVQSTTYKCHNFPPDMATNITSILPDGHQRCNLYTAWDCNMTNHVYMREVRWPGWNDLMGSIVDVDNGILSWECWDDGCVGEQTEGGCHENADGMPKIPWIGGKPYNGENPP